MSAITIDEVREEVLDRSADDHLVIADLAFTDDDITYAMKACARKYNSIPPIHITTKWDQLPSDTMLFYDGITWALVRRWLRNAEMNDFQYKAGNVAANVQGDRVNNLRNILKRTEAEFVEAAMIRKQTYNIISGYGNIG